jgi:hypothetical protein
MKRVIVTMGYVSILMPRGVELKDLLQVEMVSRDWRTRRYYRLPAEQEIHIVEEGDILDEKPQEPEVEVDNGKDPS